MNDLPVSDIHVREEYPRDHVYLNEISIIINFMIHHKLCIHSAMVVHITVDSIPFGKTSASVRLGLV